MQNRKWVGKPLKRKEDLRFLTGRGRFITDFTLPGMLHVALLRSPYPHAKIRNMDTSKAEKLEGVVKVITGRELKDYVNPFRHVIRVPDYYPMAFDKVRYAGEPVAAVAATSYYTARDAVELIDVEYEPLEAVVDSERAMQEDAPIIHEGFERNIAWHREFSYGDVEEAFNRADKIISGNFTFHRYSSTPIEPYGCAALYDRASGMITLWDQNQQVGLYRARMAEALKLPEHKLRHITLDIGGGFGNKIGIYPYSAIVSVLSMLTGKPVKWVAERREDLMSVQGADRKAQVEVAVKNDGKILGMKVKILENIGAYLRHPEPQTVTRGFFTFLGCYDIQDVYIDAYCVFTNKAPTVPNRGYGCHPAYFHLERMVDFVARELNIDKAEIRFRNLIQPNQMPYTTAFGCIYDGGDYPTALRKALEKVEYQKMREEQERLRREGRFLGIGVSAIVEPSATTAAVTALWGSPIYRKYASTTEAASIKIHPTGRVTVALGTVPQGQGHETVAAQIVAEELGITPEEVEVLPGFDSHTHPFGGESGTYASRFAVVGTGALVGAAKKLKEKILNIAAHHLETRPEDLEMDSGRIYVKDAPERYVTLKEIARAAYHQLGMLPTDVEPSLEESYTYMFPYAKPADDKLRANYSAAYAYLAGAAVVEVDVDTGFFYLRRLVIVHDAGTVINPLILEGQVHGAVAHGIGGAVYEEHAYDEATGQPLAITFADYLVPTALEIPKMEIHHMETPSTFTAIGSKGSGEGASILMPALLANAVEDALEPLGVRITSTPLSNEKIWQAIQDAKNR